MSTVKAKNIKVPNSAGTLEATLSFDGVNVVSDKPLDASCLNSTGTAPVYGCRAWVNFDGTRDSTGAASTANTARFIRASGNVTSVVRNGVGDYTVNFTTAMPDANYSIVGATIGTTLNNTVVASAATNSILISSARLATLTASNGGLVDAGIISVTIFR
jgi:hypothetical protein